MDTLANNEDSDEMQHNAEFHQGLHCLLRSKNLSGQKYIIILETSTCDPLKINWKGINKFLAKYFR